MRRLSMVTINKKITVKNSKIPILLFVFYLVQFSLSGQDLPDTVYSIKFSGRTKTDISKESKQILAGVAKTMKNRSNDNCEITSYCTSRNQRYNQASWDRALKIINYLVKKQKIDPNRFIFKSGIEGGDCNIIEIVMTKENLNEIPAPHPNLRKIKQ